MSDTAIIKGRQAYEDNMCVCVWVCVCVCVCLSVCDLVLLLVPAWPSNSTGDSKCY